MLEHVDNLLDAFLLRRSAGALRAHGNVASVLELVSEVRVSASRTELVDETGEIVLAVLLVRSVVRA